MRTSATPKRRDLRDHRSDQQGFSLLEVLIASFLLVIIMFALAQLYMYGRRHIDFEEDRRKATAVAQSRLDEARRWSYDYLGAREADNGTSANDTLMVSDARTYRVSLSVLAENPNVNATTVTAVVGWDLNSAVAPGATPDRSHSTSTIIARAFPLKGVN